MTTNVALNNPSTNGEAALTGLWWGNSLLAYLKPNFTLIMSKVPSYPLSGGILINVQTVEHQTYYPRKWAGTGNSTAGDNLSSGSLLLSRLCRWFPFLSLQIPFHSFQFVAPFCLFLDLSSGSVFSAKKSNTNLLVWLFGSVFSFDMDLELGDSSRGANDTEL
jgi:hypothetical protein